MRIESGYLHPGYAEALSEFGQPRALLQSGGWILERDIPGTNARDAMGCYPLLVCHDWSKLHLDLESLGTDLVSLGLVTDPFGDYSLEYLWQCFGDVVVPFKEHFIADLTRPLGQIVSRHHRYYAQKAKRQMKIERCLQPEEFLDEWVQLYENLAARHELKGIKAFSRTAFAAQFRVPGLVMLRATHDGETVGAHLLFVQGEVAHSHLSAVSARGYELMASYAINWFALETLSDQVRWLNFGAGAGMGSDDSDGLVRFKRGWATDKRTAYFCGRISNHEKYAEILKSRRMPESSYFPAYRLNEFS